jgi:hypothetical protein
MTYKFTLPLIAAAASLSACAIPDDNTLNRSDLATFTADDRRANSTALSFTSASDIPTGSATYEGSVRSAAIVNGEDDYDILGLLALDIDISDTATRDGTGTVRGSITELNLLDDNDNGYEDQAFDGDLSIAGNVDEGRIDATATGVLGAVLADGLIEQTSTWSLDLDGDIKTDFEDGDVAAGSVSGGTTGRTSDGYDILLTGGGGFVAQRQ